MSNAKKSIFPTPGSNSVDAFRKMALLRVAPKSPRTFVFYEMAPGIMWAVLFHTIKNDLHLSELEPWPRALDNSTGNSTASTGSTGT